MAKQVEAFNDEYRQEANVNEILEFERMMYPNDSDALMDARWYALEKRLEENGMTVDEYYDALYAEHADEDFFMGEDPDAVWFMHDGAWVRDTDPRSK